MLRTSKDSALAKIKVWEVQHALQVTKPAHRHLSGARCLSRLVSSTLAEPKEQKKSQKFSPRSADTRRGNRFECSESEKMRLHTPKSRSHTTVGIIKKFGSEIIDGWIFISILSAIRLSLISKHSISKS